MQNIDFMLWLVVSLPGPPVNIKLEEYGFDWATLSWDKGTGVRGRYEIRLLDTLRKTSRLVGLSRLFRLHNRVPTFQINTTGQRVTVNDLSPGVTFIAHITARNRKGASLPSPPVSFTPNQSVYLKVD